MMKDCTWSPGTSVSYYKNLVILIEITNYLIRANELYMVRYNELYKKTE